MNTQRRCEMLDLQRRLLYEYKSVRRSLVWNHDIDSIVFSLPGKKFNSFGIRSFFVKKIFDYIKIQAKLEGLTLNKSLPEEMFTVYIPMLAELVISLQYYHNQIIDKKSKVQTHSTVITNLLSANLLRSFIRQLIINKFAIKNENGRLYFIINNNIEKIYECVDLGQFMERNWCRYKNFKSYSALNFSLNTDIENFITPEITNNIWEDIKRNNLPLHYKSFANLYIRRIYLVNASLFVLFADMIMSLLDYNGIERNNIIQFSAYTGISFQIMNDNTDYCPPQSVAKLADDIFADVRNDNITLPLIYYFAFNPNHDLEFLNKTRIMSEKKLFELILPFIQYYSRPAGEAVAKRAELFLNAQNTESALLGDMLSISYNNKYFMDYDKAFNEMLNRDDEALISKKSLTFYSLHDIIIFISNLLSQKNLLNRV